MPDHYDVIIIGSGAGGGTLAHTLRRRRQADPDPRAGRLPARRDGQLGARRRCSSTAGTSRRTPGTTPTAQPFQPQVHYFVGGATKLYGAALYRLRPQDFGELHHVDGLSPAWPLTYDDFEPWYTKAEWLYQVHGNAGEDPTEGHWSKPYPWPAVSHEPRIQQLADDLEAGGYHPFHAPCGILLDEADRARSTCIRCTWCDGYPCLVHAKADAETIAVRPILDLPERHAAGRRRGRPSSTTDAAGRTVTGVVVTRGGSEETYRGRHRRGVGGRRRTPPSCCSRSANDRHPERAGQRLRPGRPELHVPQLQGRGGAGQGAQRHRLPEDARASTTSTSAPPTTSGPSGNIQMVGKSNAEAMKGEEPKLTKLAPHWSPGRGGRARRRLLAHDRGPARSPRTG